MFEFVIALYQIFVYSVFSQSWNHSNNTLILFAKIAS